MTMFDHYISDIHFGHYNVIRYSNRPYSFFLLDRMDVLNRIGLGFALKIFKKKATEKMNNNIIKRWNSVVKPNESVLFCGDLAYMPLNKLEKVINKLNGKLTIVKGNHDDKSIESYLKIGIHAVVPEIVMRLDNGFELKFNHYPFMKKEFEFIAKKRPNILKISKEETDPAFLSLSNTLINSELELFFIKNYSKNINYQDKVTLNKMKKLVSLFIGTKPIRSHFILAHGHTHNVEDISGNMINLCVEANNYTPISHENLLSKVNIILDRNLNGELPSDVESLLELREWIRLNHVNNKIDLTYRLNEIDLRLSYLELEQHIDKGTPINSIPIIIDMNWIKKAVDNNKFISINEIKHNIVYYGSCRHSNYAYWNGEKWCYARNKFGYIFLDTIDSIESLSDFDCFIPYREATYELDKDGISLIKDLVSSKISDSDKIN